VYEELTHLRPVVRGLKYEVENAPRTASDRTAGVLDILLKFRAWIAGQLGKLMSLFDLGSRAIDSAADSLLKSLGDAEKAISKTAAKVEHAEADDVAEDAPKKGGKGGKADKAASRVDYDLYA
jgi:hypothetical protein